jgi:cysteine-rich repeat protein
MPDRLPTAALAAILLAGPTLAADHPIAGNLLRLRDGGAAARRVRFRATREPALVPPVGDPRTAGAVLEIVGSGPGDGTTGSIALEGHRWRGLGPRGRRGWRWSDPGSTTGIRSVVLRTGGRGGSLSIDGGGRHWSYPLSRAQAAVDVRLAVGGELFCARFTRFAQNRAGRLLARNAARPADCGGGQPPPGCGNGVAEGGEECDDGNTTSFDGCSASCALETKAALCAGVPSVPGTSIRAVRVISGLDMPTYLTAPPLDPHRIFVLEQRGRVRLVKDGTLVPTPFLDISARVGCCEERGLLGLAFHPRYEANGRFFVHYTNLAGDLVIARYDTTPPADVADAAAEKILLTIPHPGHANHNGGQLAFGPDGYLYAAPGDGGGPGDPEENAQDGGSLLGKMLRLDVDVESAPFYRVPATNPFVGPGEPRDEIWATGLRNPWRFSFDRATGDLYIADVGQDLWEEIDFEAAGGPGGRNYGWDIVEGNHCFEPPSGCPTTAFVPPVLEYAHPVDPGACASVTGGYVYRGCRMPDLRGTYFYADLCAAFIRTFRGVAGGVAQDSADRTAELDPDGGLSIDDVSSFGEDARGELYVLDYGGEVFRIEPR